jgi:hypothetical protein
MNSAHTPQQTELRQLLQSKSKVPARLIEALMASSHREEQADAYFCLSERWGRIHPEMEIWFTKPFVFDFLFRSVAEPHESTDPDSHALSCYEAARGLLGILCQWGHCQEGKSIIADLIERVDSTFLAGGEAVRDCIENGFLEHALEYPEFRPLFVHWPDRPEMRDAHARALQWGCAYERQPRR